MSAKKRSFDPQELIETLQNLDFENVGGWPLPIKLGAAALVFVAVIVLGHMLIITDKLSQLDQLKRSEAELMEQFEQKAFTAQNLEQYKKQMVDMEETFGTLLSQLPRDTEVPGLLEDITHTGLGSGLDIESIELGNLTEREFFAELPITVVVKGDYHAFGSFVSGVAALPRIVTLHDFTIQPETEDGGLLTMRITAKTYRYASAQQGAGAGGGSPAPAGRR